MIDDEQGQVRAVATLVEDRVAELMISSGAGEGGGGFPGGGLRAPEPTG